MTTAPSSSRADESAHRSALASLTRSIRRLCDASVSTRAAPEELERCTREIDAIRERLEAQLHDGPYSGLMGRKLDTSTPHAMLPLSPIVGPFNPIAPDTEMRFEADRVRGTVTLGKKHSGPPHCAHGGVGALIADQIVALAASASGLRGVTRELRVRYRKPTPLYRELEVEAWCEERSEERAVIRGEIRCDGVVTVETEGEIVTARRLTHPEERKSAAGL